MEFVLKLGEQKLWKECEIEEPNKNVRDISRRVRGRPLCRQGQAAQAWGGRCDKTG